MRKQKRSEIRNAKKALDLLDVFFADQSIKYGEQAGLWNVLSALRGPDAAGSYGLKADTTEVIRTAAFPRVEKIAMDTSLPANFATPDHALDEAKLSGDGTDHFSRHIRSAAQALRAMGKMQGDLIVSSKARSK